MTSKRSSLVSCGYQKSDVRHLDLAFDAEAGKCCLGAATVTVESFPAAGQDRCPADIWVRHPRSATSISCQIRIQ
jgi:hypothetical protein